MKKWLILLCISSFALTSLTSAESLQEKIISRGISVAVLSDEDEINIQLSRLEQAIQQQNSAVIFEILSPDYSEENQQFKKKNIESALNSSFSAISTARNIPVQSPGKAGWRKTASSDFLIRNPKIILNKEKDKAQVECDLAFFSIEGDTIYKEENHRNTEDKLVFVKKSNLWYLSKSDGLFYFIERVPLVIKNNKTVFAEKLAADPLANSMKAQAFSEQDLTSNHMLNPKIFYNHPIDGIVRLNRTTSNEKFDGSIFGQPHSIMAYLIYGGSVETHEYLVISDPSWDRLIASDQLNSWTASYGNHGSGTEEFKYPHGIASLGPHEYFIADTYNNRIVNLEVNYETVTWKTPITVAPGTPNAFNAPMDVDVLPGNQSHTAFLMVADYGNNRIIIWRWVMNGWHGVCYTHDEENIVQFNKPASISFGRNQDGSQNLNIFIVDKGSNRLLYFGLYEPDMSLYFKGSYQFTEDACLTSVDVDNKGLVYVTDGYHGKVYKFLPFYYYGVDSPYLLGIYGEIGSQDGQLYYPRAIAISHGINCDQNGYSPIAGLGDAFVSEYWTDQTGVRRYVLGVDAKISDVTYYPPNLDTGGGNYVDYWYFVTDYANVTEKIYRGGQLIQSMPRGVISPGQYYSVWDVEDNLNGIYDVAIIASSIYSGSNTDSVSAQVLVDKNRATHNPVITEAVHFVGNLLCINCSVGNPLCIINGNSYTVRVKAFDPDDDSISYTWSASCGYFGYPTFPPGDSVSYYADCLSLRDATGMPEVITVTIRDTSVGVAVSSIYFTPVEPEDCVIRGDVNRDGFINVSDIVYLVNYLFQCGPAPQCDPITICGDANCDGAVDAADIVFLVNYLFIKGPVPHCP